MSEIPPALYAFPFTTPSQACPGMELRDYFAAAIMGGIAANSAQSIIDKPASECVAKAYQVADAMMEARK